MDSEFRDLGRIQEQDDDTAMRRLSLIAMGAFAVVAVIFATGVMVVKGVERQNEEGYDPLSELMANGKIKAKYQTQEKQDDVDDVNAEELVFPEALRAEHEDPRAEMEAALAAAAAEEAHPDPIAHGELAGEPSEIVTSAEESITAEVASGRALSAAKRPEAAPTPSVQKFSANTQAEPKAVIKVHKEVKKAKRSTNKGDFSLQIISYTSSEEAHDYAKLLESRGHSDVFVLSSKLAKGDYWRVRIGPFASRDEAEAYQRRFEQKEQLKTLVVRSVN